MASPVDADRVGTNTTTAQDSYSVTLPGSIAAGDLLIGYSRNGGAFDNTGPSWPAGWNEFSITEGQDASDDGQTIAYRWADGSESGSIVLTPVSTDKAASIIWRITGAENPSTQAPERSSASGAVGTAANIDGDPITPTGGSKDYLFLVILGMDGETQAISSPPSGYGNLVTANSGTGGAAATNVRVGGASRQATVSSEDPGTWTHGAPTNGVTTWTIAVHPAAAATEFAPPTVLFERKTPRRRVLQRM